MIRALGVQEILSPLTPLLCRRSISQEQKQLPKKSGAVFIRYVLTNYFIASAVATATATVAPTMGLLPMPRKPIISTCAGTEEEPAN